MSLGSYLFELAGGCYRSPRLACKRAIRRVNCAPMKRDYGFWHSPSLGRKMEYLWFGHWGRPIIMFPTSMGRFYQNEDFGLVGALADKMDAGHVQIICVDSIDEESWYNKNIHPRDRAWRQAQYDHYIRHEVVPYIQHRAGRSDIVTCGASFGAYHAANTAGRYPGLVTKAILFSGLYHIGRYLNGYWDETAYFHCPEAFVSNSHGDSARELAKVEWIIATGENDSLIGENRHFAGLLQGKGCPVHAEFWPGVFGHDWPFWNEAIRRFI